MEQNINQVSMTKEEKRARIKQLENGLELIAKHKKDIAELEKTTTIKTASTVELALQARNKDGHVFHSLHCYTPDFIKPTTILKLYKMEIDEEEARTKAELEKLIA